MSAADFRKRLQQAEMAVKPGLFEQVLAARARKKNMRYWFAGSLVSLLLFTGAVIFWQVDTGGEAKQVHVNKVAKRQPTVSEKNTSLVASPTKNTSRNFTKGDVSDIERIASAKSSNSGKYVSKPYTLLELNAAPPVSAAQSGWTVFPPLSALDKPLNAAGAEYLEALYGKWFGLLPSRNRKPEAALKSAYNSGLRPVHNDWLIEVLAEPAHMQVRSGAAQYNKLLNSTENQQIAMQAVIRAGRQLGSNFRWFAGLKWSEQRSRFDYKRTITQSTTVVDVKQLIIKEPGFPDRQITVHDTNTLYSTVHSVYSASNRLQMIGIPLGLQYAPSGRSGSLYVFGSLMPAYVLNTRGIRVLPDGNVMYMESQANIRRFQLNTELGLGMRKTLAQGLFVTLEPRLSYGLLNLSRIAVRQHGFNAGMSIGLSFRPGR